ncbi:hypothetical protein LJR231_002791 [Phyllobacterium sp. LjRoot231]|uniref:hypothetical protein n=1 Tax=Phyllobacterium sp. LjRoot231 TaxID=3342289 RepID=UPI003ED0920E
MTLDEVCDFGGYVQLMMDEYEKRGQIAGQCFTTSLAFAEKTEMLIHRTLPVYRNSRIKIEIGNVLLDGRPQFNEDEARSIAARLPPLDFNRNLKKQYHSWLTFEQSVIDLTLMYTAYAQWSDTRNKPCVVFVAEGDLYIPRDFGFRYKSYRTWSLPEMALRGYVCPCS